MLLLSPLCICYHLLSLLWLMLWLLLQAELGRWLTWSMSFGRVAVVVVVTMLIVVLLPATPSLVVAALHGSTYSLLSGMGASRVILHPTSSSTTMDGSNQRQQHQPSSSSSSSAAGPSTSDPLIAPSPVLSDRKGVARFNSYQYQSWDENDSNTTRTKGGQTYSMIQGDGDDNSAGEDDDDHSQESSNESHDNIQANSDIGDDDDDAELRKRRRRRVYGGGARSTLGSSGNRGVLAVSYSLFVSSISPATPLLIPYAFSLTGLSFGVPLLIILVGLGSSFSHVILTVEARYVGASSYANTAAAVFPQVYGIKWAGEVLAHAFTAFVSGARALVALYIATDLLADLLYAIFPHARVLHSRIFISLLLGLGHLLPSLLIPRRRLPHHHYHQLGRSTSVPLPTQLAELSVLLYPLILLVVGVSLKNLSDYPSLLKPRPHLGRPHWSSEPLHTPTLWSGVSVLFFACASNQQDTFVHYRSLRRAPSSTNPANDDLPSADPDDPSSSSASKQPSTNTIAKLFNRHRWESVTILSSFFLGLLHVGFGLVGYLSLLRISPNVFSVLPRDHTWFNIARFLVLCTILPLLSKTMEPCRNAFNALLAVPRRCMSPYRGGGKAPLRSSSSRNAGHSKRRSSSVFDYDTDEDDLSDEGDVYADNSTTTARGGRGACGSTTAKNWETRLATLLSWGIVISLACVVRDLGGIAEVVGAVGSTWFGFILPGASFSSLSLPLSLFLNSLFLSLSSTDMRISSCPAAFFITLFHIRSPRTIFMTSTSSHTIQTDTLLLQKERQLQKRLMGRRLWMDLGTFGLLLPVGVVGFARGCWALASS
jgi:hypothetical protein